MILQGFIEQQEALSVVKALKLKRAKVVKGKELYHIEANGIKVQVHSNITKDKEAIEKLLESSWKLRRNSLGRLLLSSDEIDNSPSKSTGLYIGNDPNW